MENLEFNQNRGKRVPINRNNLFFSRDSYNFEKQLGKTYLEQDVNQTVVLYEVDLEKTNLNQTYHESKQDGIVFKTPVELHVLYNIQESELRTYNNSKNVGSYIKTGQLTFGIYQETLDELDSEIKIGDYIGVQITPTHMEYFTVINDGRINYDNRHSIYGYSSGWRSVKCAPVDSVEFNGK